MAWSRFLDVLDAALLRVDEATYQARAEAAAGQRDVRSYRGQYGLRTLVARAEAGDVAAFEALIDLVADCLAAEGDEEPVGVRRSKALGVIGHQARLRDLLARHADQPDDPRHPEDRVAAHQDDPTDPWAADDLPPAGWETEKHGNYHQPGLRRSGRPRRLLGQPGRGPRTRTRARKRNRLDQEPVDQQIASGPATRYSEHRQRRCGQGRLAATTMTVSRRRRRPAAQPAKPPVADPGRVRPQQCCS